MLSMFFRLFLKPHFLCNLYNILFFIIIQAMLFNSFEFFLFFPIVCVAYFFVTHRIKSNVASQILLLAASLFFYACWKPAYLALILLSVVITYASGILMEKISVRDETIRKPSMNTPPPHIPMINKSNLEKN